jgi:hypothetical protein
MAGVRKIFIQYGILLTVVTLNWDFTVPTRLICSRQILICGIFATSNAIENRYVC